MAARMRQYAVSAYTADTPMRQYTDALISVTRELRPISLLPASI